jgi:AmiR/NasT family two-component response regulator
VVDDWSEHKHLRVMVANERSDRLDYVTELVVSLGHEVVARTLEVQDVGALTALELPDLALVGLGDNSKHALDLIDEVVRTATCPVITLLETDDPPFVAEAARRGVFAFIVDTDRDQLQGSIEIVLRRFAEFSNLEGAFERRAVIERAKGILMERHSIAQDEAFDLLRSHSRTAQHRLIDLATSVTTGHLLLPRTAPDS